MLIFFDPENMKNCPQKLLIIGLQLFLCTSPAAQTTKKQRYGTTKRPLIQDQVCRLGAQLISAQLQHQKVQINLIVTIVWTWTDPTATTTTEETTEPIKTTTPYQPPPPGLYNAPPPPTPALYNALPPPPPNGLYNAPIGSWDSESYI